MVPVATGQSLASLLRRCGLFHNFPGGRELLTHPRCTTRLSKSPLGGLLLAWKEKGLTWVSFLEGSKAIEPGSGWVAAAEPAFGAGAQLQSYFSGDLEKFDLPLAPRGTAFQQEIWRELTRIPFAGTASYGEIARRVGRPKASRAVGAANGKNPLPIVVPCTRVVGSDGSLTGYSGGMEIKDYLLPTRPGTLRAEGDPPGVPQIGNLARDLANIRACTEQAHPVVRHAQLSFEMKVTRAGSCPVFPGPTFATPWRTFDLVKLPPGEAAEPRDEYCEQGFLVLKGEASFEGPGGSPRQRPGQPSWLPEPPACERRNGAAPLSR